MVKSLILVWVVGVVAFFALWALLAFIIRRVSDKRRTENGERKVAVFEEGDKKEATPENDD